MFFPGDMKELISIFEKYSVKYVLIGGFAVNYYGYVRATQDIDLLVYPSRKNAEAWPRSRNSGRIRDQADAEELLKTAKKKL